MEMNEGSATSHPLRPLVPTYFNRSGNKGPFRLPGLAWDHPCCTVEPLPGHIRCRFDILAFEDHKVQLNDVKKGEITKDLARFPQLQLTLIACS